MWFNEDVGKLGIVITSAATNIYSSCPRHSWHLHKYLALMKLIFQYVQGVNHGSLLKYSDDVWHDLLLQESKLLI